MTVTATGYESQISAAVIGMLAASATWQGVCSAASASAARAFLVEDWAGDDTPRNVDGTPLDLRRPWAVVRSKGMNPELVAALTFLRSGEVQIFLHLPIVDGDQPAEVLRRARNLASDTCQDLEAQLGTPGCLMSATIAPGETTVAPIAAPEEGVRMTETPITIRWSEAP